VSAEELVAHIVEMAAVRPGDSLILRIRDGGTEDLRQALETFRGSMPDNVRVVAVTEAVEVTILRTGE
jgi:hypothetical protein